MSWYDCLKMWKLKQYFSQKRFFFFTYGVVSVYEGNVVAQLQYSSWNYMVWFIASSDNQEKSNSQIVSPCLHIIYILFIST